MKNNILIVGNASIYYFQVLIKDYEYRFSFLMHNLLPIRHFQDAKNYTCSL